MALSSGKESIALKESMSKPESSFSILQSQVFLSQLGLENLYDARMEIKDEIAAWVRAARKSAGLSGEALGRELALELRTTRGNTKGNISHWELGKHQPSLSQLLAISKITGHPLPASIEQNVDANRSGASPEKLKIAAPPGYEYFLEHISQTLANKDVPPHIQSAIITLLDTCPPKKV